MMNWDHLKDRTQEELIQHIIAAEQAQTNWERAYKAEKEAKERAEAALDAAMKDAERYRYLRQVDRAEQWENLLMVRPIWSSEAIDAAIDAAIAEGKS